MAPFLIQIFTFMTCTFLLGMLLGWLIWRHGWVEKPSETSEEDDVEFWRARLEQSRNELWAEKATVEGLRTEQANLKKRIASLEA